jgi:dihydroflavonol-4-reductase
MEIEGKKILVTGATGHLGSNIVHYLVDERGVRPGDIEIFNPKGTPIDNLADLHGLDYCEGDITDAKSVKAAVEDRSLIWHVAGNTTFDPFKRKGQWLVNVEGTRNVLDAAKNAGRIEKIVYTSTVNTLGAPNPPGSLGSETTSPYDESTRSVHSFETATELLEFASKVHDGSAGDAWWKRIGVGYFDSKLAGQELVNKASLEDGLPVVSVLPGTFFGPRDFFIGSGIYILEVYQNKLPGFIPTGFPLVHVHDVARGHVFAMEKGTAGERYIICGNDEDNRYLIDMLHIIAKVMTAEEPGKKIKANWKPIPISIAMFAARLSEAWAGLTKTPCLLSTAAIKAAKPVSFYTCKKARTELGYEPEFSFEQAARDHFRYFKEKDMLKLKGRKI